MASDAFLDAVRFDAAGLVPVVAQQHDTGEVLTVLATDPGAPADFTHFCETTHNELVATGTVADHFRIQIRRLV